MPRERVPMRHVREILRLAWSCGQSRSAIAKSCGIGKTTVTDTLTRAVAAKLSWPLPAPLSDDALEDLLYPSRHSPPVRHRPEPDWPALQRELVADKDLTIMLLWQEYKARQPDGYQYSQFCELFRSWRNSRDLCMRQEHRPGDKLFVDYCGRTLPIIDAATGKVREAQVFVAVMGASNYTYAEATFSQGLADWIGSHVRAFSYFGGVPRAVVPDNLRAAVSKSCRYEPLINPSYQEMAGHYGTAIIPARVRRPKDKAKAEVGVQIVQRFILAPLRHRRFYSLAEANAAIRERLELLNERRFHKLPGSRQSRFLELDQPALLPLPESPYLYAQWKKASLGFDYHFDVDGHFYSAPHKLRGAELHARYTETTVECFHRGERVASHARSQVKGGHTTIPDHMPTAHREYTEWTPDRFISWARQIGDSCAQVITILLERRSYPEHAFRSCRGILALAKRYGKERLEAACARALTIKGISYRSIKSILEKNLDAKPLPQPAQPPPIPHDNLRGPEYFNPEKELSC